MGQNFLIVCFVLAVISTISAGQLDVFQDEDNKDAISLNYGEYLNTDKFEGNYLDVDMSNNKNCQYCHLCPKCDLCVGCISCSFPSKHCKHCKGCSPGSCKYCPLCATHCDCELHPTHCDPR